MVHRTVVSATTGGRWDFSGGRSDWNASDCDGHGTHVASVAAGRTVGVAKEANVVAVKVLDCDGSGTISTVTAGKSHIGTSVSGHVLQHSPEECIAPSGLRPQAGTYPLHLSRSLAVVPH